MMRQYGQESGFSARALRKRAAAVLNEFDDLTIDRLPALGEGLSAAAVLVPVIDRRGVATVLLTRRADDLPQHAGQIAFPGGRIDPTDVTLFAAALRETREETGIDERHVEPVARLERHDTGTGFAIYPVLGILAPGFRLAACTREVAEIFEVPLPVLMDPVLYRRETLFWRGEHRSFLVIEYGSHRIWGATAAILKRLQERLYGL